LWRQIQIAHTKGRSRPLATFGGNVEEIVERTLLQAGMTLHAIYEELAAPHVGIQMLSVGWAVDKIT